MSVSVLVHEMRSLDLMVLYYSSQLNHVSSHKLSLLPDDPNSTETSNREHQCSCTFTFLTNQQIKEQSSFLYIRIRMYRPFFFYIRILYLES